MENKTLQPYDLRLALLRLLAQWRRILVITAGGILLLGGGYILKNIVMSPAPAYGAESVYYVEYGTDPVTGNAYTYINAYSWNEWLHTEEFLEDISSRLSKGEVTGEELSAAIRADLPSDLRMPVTLVTTRDPDLSVRVARAVEESMVAFADRQREIESIRVVTGAESADRIRADVRPIRALILSAVVSFLAAVLFLFIRDTYLQGLWLPVQVRRDYGLVCAGAPELEEVRDHLAFLLEGCDSVGLLPVGRISEREVRLAEETLTEGALAEGVSEEGGPEGCPAGPKRVRTFPVYSGKGDYAGLRSMDGVILLLGCGEREGGRLQYALEGLSLQRIPVKGALLYGVSPFLQRAYYSMEPITVRKDKAAGGRRQDWE